MDSFTDLIAHRIQQRLHEFKESVARTAHNDLACVLAEGVRTHWRALDHVLPVGDPQAPLNGSAAAVDGSQAVCALHTGADEVIAQALLIGPGKGGQWDFRPSVIESDGEGGAGGRG